MQNHFTHKTIEPKIYSASEHHVHNHLINSSALFVIDKLHEMGHIAYLVGGSVRDLLMNKSPKDYDVSTSARPEEIKKIFQRNCILVGRRFRLAHVRFENQVIEVSTFRAGDPQDELLIVKDNIWGSPEEDVLRRDFTINGLFYNPQKREIIDYVGGFEDLKQHLLRCIGNPEFRFKQDPVRMIRFQKFRARFGFQVEDTAIAALYKCRQEIVKSSPARVLEEIFRMLESGASESFFRLLTESELIKILFPLFESYLHTEMGETIYAYLKAADSINQEKDRILNRSLLTSCLVYPILHQEIHQRYLDKGHQPHFGEVFHLCQELIHDLFFAPFSHFPRRIRQEAQSICSLQYRLTPLNPNKPLYHRIVKQKDFHPALLFLKLRTLIDHRLFKVYSRWKQIHQDSKRSDA